MKNDVNPTILVLASSKRTEQSYMETFIENKKKNESKTTLVIDEPQWVIREDKNSDTKFKVAVGNKFLSSEVLPLDATDEMVQMFRNRGYSILEVPIGYYETFIDDIDIALTDVAGMSTTNSSRYISGPRLVTVKDSTLKNPFTMDIIEVGNGPDDTTQYWDYFNLDNVDKRLMEYPMFIHLDMSISGDKTGIAGMWICGKKPPQEGLPPSKELFYQLAFSVSVKAPKGYQISFEKNRQFIYWLKEQGFRIKGVSSDTFQSADLLQQLQAKKFNTEIISVDRVKDRICLPYQYFKSTIYEERIKMYDSVLLTEEIIGLERNNNTGKIDHSPSGINCFTGDTKVRLLDGRALSFVELVEEYNKGKENYVYSFNHNTQRIEPGLITNAWKSGENAHLVLVTLDNGEQIKCTPEHKFMLRDGSYKEAQSLHEGDSLMPLYTKVSEKGLNGYRLYFEPFEDKWHYEHRQFASEVLDEKYLVHHKNCDKLNNSPNNLIWCSAEKHQQIHAEMQTGAQSPEASAKRCLSVKEYHAKNKENKEYWCRFFPGCTPEEAYNKHLQKEYEKQVAKEKFEYRHNHNKAKKEKQLAKQQEMAEHYGIILESLKDTELQSLMIKYAHEMNPTYEERVIQSVKQRHAEGKYVNARKALDKCNQESKMLKELFPVVDKDVFYELFNIHYDDIDSHKRAPWVTKYRKALWDRKNHRVKSVVTLLETADVFDITIQNNHNFALDSGVFVHNSKDMADAVCGSLWNASQHGDEFNFEFGETLDAMIDISQEASEVNYKQQAIIDFEEELKKVSSEFSSSPFDDFGFGKSLDVSGFDILDGIII